MKTPVITDIRNNNNVTFSEITGLATNQVVIMTTGQFRKVIETETPEKVSMLLDSITFLGTREHEGNNDVAVYAGVGTPTVDKGWMRMLDMHFAIPHGTEIPWISFRTSSPITKDNPLTKIFATTKAPLGRNIRSFRLADRNENVQDKEGQYYYTFNGQVFPIRTEVKLDTVIPLPGWKNQVLLNKGLKFDIMEFNAKTGTLEKPNTSITI